jgi:hypothetical protein
MQTSGTSPWFKPDNLLLFDFLISVPGIVMVGQRMSQIQKQRIAATIATNKRSWRIPNEIRHARNRFATGRSPCLPLSLSPCLFTSGRSD